MTQHLIRLLVVNPNSSVDVTKKIEQSLRSTQALSGIQFTFWTAPETAPGYIISHNTEIQSAAVCLPEILKIPANSYDGILIACFSAHPLVHTLRECLPSRQPVVGIFEPALFQASQVGDKFAIITTTPKWGPMLQEAIHHASFDSRSAGVYPVLPDSKPIGHDETLKLLVEAGAKAQAAGATVLILGGAKFAGLEDELRKQLHLGDTQFVDAMSAGVQVLVGLVRSGLKTARLGTYAPDS